jgi:hypothetical protein
MVELKKRGLPSPDLADAIALTFCDGPEGIVRSKRFNQDLRERYSGVAIFRMTGVRNVTVQIHKPSKQRPLGQICHGHYVLKDGVITMTDRDANPPRTSRGKNTPTG